MANSNISTGQQTDTATGAITGSLDISALARAGHIKCRVDSLTSGKTVSIAIEDSVDAFSATRIQHVFQFTGPLTGSKDNVKSIALADLPHLRVGVTDAVVRGNITAIDAGTTVKSFIWLEQ